jgi:hypothetical protein
MSIDQPRLFIRPRTWGLLVVVLSLAGCAGTLRIDNQVRSFAQWSEASPTPSGSAASHPAPQPPQNFRFDRLPSQQAPGGNLAQDRLESLAAAELQAFGWQLAESGTGAAWRVQVEASTQRLSRAPWEDPWDGYRGYFHAGVGLGTYRSGAGGVIWVPVLPPPSAPYFLREVSLVIREAGSGQVVYETRANHEGRWNSTPELWSAMLRAALQGFPNPPAGPRRVDIDIERRAR